MIRRFKGRVLRADYRSDGFCLSGVQAGCAGRIAAERLNYEHVQPKSSAPACCRRMNVPALLMAQTTCASPDDAERLARGLVEAHLAACVSIGAPVRSIYPWQGRVSSADEVPLLIKTSSSRLPALKAFLVEHHAYELPELLVTPVIDGHEPYLRWADQWLEG